MLPFENIKRKELIKRKASTSSEYGVNPDKRPADVLLNYGVVNINKPSGPTSHQVSDFVKKILGVSKAGHSGTLDPGVTGVLPVAIGDATKVVQALISHGKEYICLMRIHKSLSEKQIREVLDSFVGKIKQLPPVKSAVKRQVREKEIYYIKVLEIEDKNVLFRIGCQAGTYIRKLCHDIGRKLGTGAHMQELIRTKAGPFKLEDTITLQDLTDALWYFKEENNEKYLRHCIKTVESAVSHLPKIWILDNTVNTICHGAKLAIPGISKLESGIKEGDLVAVLTLKGELVSLGVARISSDEIMKNDSGIAVKTDRVFMKIGVYPKK
jgi:H/ACA ribonucleoprotein complex subunit 4